MLSSPDRPCEGGTRRALEASKGDESKVFLAIRYQLRQNVEDDVGIQDGTKETGDVGLCSGERASGLRSAPNDRGDLVSSCCGVVYRLPTDSGRSPRGFSGADSQRRAFQFPPIPQLARVHTLGLAIRPRVAQHQRGQRGRRSECLSTGDRAVDAPSGTPEE